MTIEPQPGLTVFAYLASLSIVTVHAGNG